MMNDGGDIMVEEINTNEFSEMPDDVIDNNHTNDHVVVLQDVKKDYLVKGRSVPVRALRGATLEIEKGSMVAIKGESGSGKTTLLQIIGALDVATSGTAIVDGKDLSSMSEMDLTEYRAKTIGFVFQSFNLIPNLSALENVELPMEALNVPKMEKKNRAYELLKAVGMEERVDYKPMKLSGGEQQRVAIARALANDPSIILADEPTGSLDTKTGKSIVQLLDKLRKKRGTTVIIVTHSNKAARACDLTFTIEDGVIASKKNLVQEAETEGQKSHLKKELAISGSIIDKLFDAGYDELMKIGNANQEELSDVLGDKGSAEKIAKKAGILLKKKVAELETKKEFLAIDLSVTEEVISQLFGAGYTDLETIAVADAEELGHLLGNDDLAIRITEKAELLILKD